MRERIASSSAKFIFICRNSCHRCLCNLVILFLFHFEYNRIKDQVGIFMLCLLRSKSPLKKDGILVYSVLLRLLLLTKLSQTKLY
jgi:hypothetical protein